MATKKFKKNLISLINLFETTEELVDFLAKKKAFSEDFTRNITDSDYLQKLKSIEKFDPKEIKKRLQYEIAYKDNKISVDITQNGVFSYTDTEEELKTKMKKYLMNEDYEKAQILNNYFNTIDLEYKQSKK